LVCNDDHSGDFATVGKGSIDDLFDASQAVTNGCIFLRSDKALYCIGGK
jgi:hypothetical protein